MNIDGKSVLNFTTNGLAALSVLTAFYFSRWGGVVCSILFAVGLLIQKNISVHGELKKSLTNLTQVHSELKGEVQTVATELATVKNQIATKTGLPVDGKYLELQHDGCELFKYAADRVYQKARKDLEALANRQITIINQEDVYEWLAFLFKSPNIMSIKATSYGESKEWMAVDSWWLREYVALHRSAQQRGASIERIFIVKNEHDAKSVEGVLRNNRKYNVSVKVAFERRLRPPDLHAKNCLVFCNERDEPLYALIAQHNREGFQSAVIFGAPHEVEQVATMYHHIAQIAEPYVDAAIDSRKLLTRFDRTSLG
jgi:hypothetical protein